jgi:uncharacterized protein YggL (DUF469 family)
MARVITLVINDTSMDRIIDDLVVAAGGERGFTYEGCNIARWNLRKALLDENKRQREDLRASQ